MQSKQQNKDISAVIISIVLHVILFGLLILGSLYHRVEIMGGGEGEGDVMGAVMVDTGAAAQEWGRLQQQKKGQTDKPKKPEPVVEEKPDQQEILRQQEIEKQKALEKQKDLERQKEAERQKQLLEQKKQEEKARLEALEKQKQAEEAKAKQAAEAARLKAEAEAKRLAALAKQAEEEAKAKAAEAKAKAEKAKADAEAKAKAEKAKADAKAKADKAKAEAAQRKAEQAALDDFMNGGDVGGGSASKGSNANRQGSQGSGAALGAGDGGKTGDQYAGVIKREIQRRFLKEPSFANKVCIVEVEFLRDGTIASYQRVSGDDDICNAAISAVARTKKVPAAPSDEIYQKYKKSPIEFKLR
ncbi:cell envelope integrity protein TolA [Pasteurella dagmatis]|uniref:Protein TolA n=1 Tax=Pasteurella dagmatis ATCC 43325 TaxID=667128 RepID=C9PMN4_9PAST|nr:cell envelope integrity protein TolA [Pasteurella dagmatis]EEX51068.1 protein TolA [Pasteurella dagmatis ATCC 43325]SNV41931.1 protein TolA [Pasteurella dagmatis]